MARSYTHFGAQRLLCVALALVLLSSLPTRAFTPAYAQTTLRIFTSGVRLPVAGAQIGNWFGGPIATNGDGTVLVIGAPYRMFGQPGAAYVFVRATTADTFTHVATLHASDGADRDCFSSSVALSADGTTIVIGRVAIGPLGYIGTTAYLFVRPPTGWVHATETAQLTATALAPGDAFGWSIAVSANGGTVAISASSDNSGLGAVYMYTRPIQGWSSSTQTAQLSATSDEGQFGASLAISSDGGTLAVGTPSGNDSVYVFERPLAGWVDATETAKLMMTGSANYVMSIAISANGAVIAAGSIAIPAWTGSIYIFERGGGWSSRTEQAILIGHSDDFLGIQIAISADGDTIAASAYQADIGSVLDAGAVSLFSHRGSSWLEYQRIYAPTPRARSQLGRYLTLSGDATTLVVEGYGGPPDSMSADLGVAYVFQVATSQIFLPLVLR